MVIPGINVALRPHEGSICSDTFAQADRELLFSLLRGEMSKRGVYY